jgi:hypothetical protein
VTEGLPTAIDKRNMLYAPDARRPFDPIALGDSFVEKGRVPEGLDFYERIADEAVRRDRIERVKSLAVKQGNAFVLSRISSKGMVAVSTADWRSAAQAAKSAGHLRYALRAAIQANEEALVAEMRAALGDAVPAALAAQAESPEQAKAGATTPGHKVEAVAAAGVAHSHEPAPADNGGGKA